MRESDRAVAGRRVAMAVLAHARRGELETAWANWPAKPDWRFERAPETGLVMVRGRIGGGGTAFNLGETTVTRCVVALGSGEKGFAYVMGRDRRKAELAALFDALWQDPARRDLVEKEVLAPLKEAQTRDDTLAARRTAATKVDFFTLFRGDE